MGDFVKNSEINIRDPFVLTYNGKYYMYGTRAADFGIKTGGFDVYVGTDLENWSEPIEVFNSNKYGLNTAVNWAPEVHEFEGKFYMFATFKADDKVGLSWYSCNGGRLSRESGTGVRKAGNRIL